MKEIHLVEIEYCEDTQPGQSEASRKQQEVLCKRLKVKKDILHTIFLGAGGSISSSHSSNHLIELGLDTQKARKTALKLHAHPVPYVHILTTTRRALEKSRNPDALEDLVLNMGRLVTLQIRTTSSFFLVEETPGSSGQCLLFLH